MPAAAMPVAMISAAKALSRSLLNSTIAPEFALPPVPAAGTADDPLRTMASRWVPFCTSLTTL